MKIENTSSRDAALHLLGALGGVEDYVIGMERAGQGQLVASTSFPTQLSSGTDEDLIALGFTLGEPDPRDPLFRPATLPEGWVKRATDHAMGSEIVDQHGRVRVKVFYKAAFYDRRADASIVGPSGYARDLVSGAPLVLDDWATAEVVLAALDEIVEFSEEPARQGRDSDGYWAKRAADAKAVIERVKAATA